MRINEIRGKRIFFIAPKFYNYHNLILTKLRLLGADVTFYSDSQNDFFSKIKRILGYYDETDEKRYYKKMVEYSRTLNYDYLFVIKGNGMSEDFLKNMISYNPGIKSILYQWDSVRNYNYLPFVKFFDKTYTFDLLDFNENNNLHYLPLFYSSEIKKIEEDKELLVEDIDLLFIGSYLPERYNALEVLIKYARANKLKLNHHFFVPRSYFIELKRKGIKMDNSLVKFNSLDESELLKLYRRSKVIVDVSSVNQTGLSMRAIECLGAGKKLLTTNKNILKHRFFSEGQVAIMDLGNLSIKKGFIDQKITPNKDIQNQYLDNWLLSIFNMSSQD